MKRILTAALLALGVMAVSGEGARANGFGPGYFNFGINIRGEWGRTPGCNSYGYCPPAMYSAYPYGAPAHGGYPYELAGYGAPYGHGVAPDYGHAAAGQPGQSDPRALAGYGYGTQGAPAGYGYGAQGASAGYGYSAPGAGAGYGYGAPAGGAGYGAAPASTPTSYGAQGGYGY
jgi:hypothetical protein